MNTTKYKIFFIALLIIYLFPDKSYAREDKEIYYQAIKAVREGKLDFAFMDFHMVVNGYPESKYFRDALFAVGEYYFSTGNYLNAFENFKQFINNYPQSIAKIFASVYLLETAEIIGKKEVINDLRKEIITSKQLSLLFRDFKEYYYVSPFSKIYKAVYFIDRVEFYIDGKLFTQVFY